MTADGSALSDRIDRLSLEQALRDAEVAAARVNDLTQRLIALNAENQRLAQELHHANHRIDAMSVEMDSVMGTRAYWIARKVVAAKSLLRR